MWVDGEVSRRYMREERYVVVFFFNDTATTEIYTLSLHDALPIYKAMKNRQPTNRSSLLTLCHQGDIVQ